jgi:hypothetical protein
LLLPEGSDSRVAFSSDSQFLIASRDDGFHAWEVQPPRDSSEPPALRALAAQRPAGFSSLCLVSNQAVLTCSLGSKILQFEALSANEAPWSPTIAGVNGASADGQFLAVFRPYTPWLHLYSLPTFERLAVLTNQTNIREFEFSPDGKRLRVFSNSGIASWNTGNWEPTGHITNFIGGLFPARGETSWLTKDFHTAGLYRNPASEPLLPLPYGSLPLALSPDARTLAVSRHAQTVQLWDLEELNRQFAELGVAFPR